MESSYHPAGRARRLEYWEARTQTAWVVAEPAGGIHEGTSRRLPHLAERIALVRGAPIASFGSVDLLLRDPDGVPERMMQADETLYLHPDRATLPAGSLVVGEHDLPDVVLEVDHTTTRRCSIGEQARAAELAAAVRSVLQARGIGVSDSFPAGSRTFADVSRDALMAAAVACTGEADFWRRLPPPSH